MVTSVRILADNRGDFCFYKKDRMNYKAIITHIDGTALDSPIEKTVSERLTNAVTTLELNGIKVCAATGRAESFAKPVLESMGLRHPAIVSSGTQIIDPVSGDVLWSCGLSADRVEKIVDLLKNTNYGFLWNDSTEADYLSGGWSIDKFNEYESTYFFEVCFVPYDEVTKLVESLKDIEGIAVTVVNAQRPNTNDIHITNKVATKEHAVYELEKIINIRKEDMIGVGDGHNDIDLFKAVNYKVAMGNAVQELKDAADEVIDSVKDDGLAKYFERLLKEIQS